MKILVTGAAGMLGSKLMEVLAEDHEVSGRDLDTIDIRRLEDVRSVLDVDRPEVVVNAAAFTAVDACESEIETAFASNALGVRNLAIATRERDAAIFHVSTDYVFDGEKPLPYDEFDTPNPRSIYGKSKLAGEQEIREHAGAWYIGRVQWLYGEGGANFADTILRLSREKPFLRVVDDQHGCPTYTGDAAVQIKLMLEARAYGLHHMSANGETTWYGFTRALLDREGRDGYHLQPVATDQFPRPAPRPRNSVLRNLALELGIGDSMPPWEDGVNRYMQRRNELESTRSGE